MGDEPFSISKWVRAGDEIEILEEVEHDGKGGFIVPESVAKSMEFVGSVTGVTFLPRANPPEIVSSPEQNRNWLHDAMEDWTP